jgi:hypothetical protein
MAVPSNQIGLQNIMIKYNLLADSPVTILLTKQRFGWVSLADADSRSVAGIKTFRSI